MIDLESTFLSQINPKPTSPPWPAHFSTRLRQRLWAAESSATPTSISRHNILLGRLDLAFFFWAALWQFRGEETDNWMVELDPMWLQSCKRNSFSMNLEVKRKPNKQNPVCPANEAKGRFASCLALLGHDKATGQKVHRQYFAQMQCCY